MILLYPVLDHGDLRRLILTVMTFAPVILATITLSQKKNWVWPAILLMLGALIFGIVSTLLPNRTLLGIKWGFLAAFFAFAVAGLFSYIRNAQSVFGAHLYTAVSIYLLLGLLWFAVYCVIDIVYPGAFARADKTMTNGQSELLYFSLVTLSTIGYGDVVPVNGEARILAALEGITGLLYVAITVALLVNAYKQHSSSSDA